MRFAIAAAAIVTATVGCVDDDVTGEGEGDPGEGEVVVGEGEGEGESVARPASSLGTGFYVVDGAIYDKHGAPFVMRGLNHTHAWGNQDDNLAAVDEFPKTGANAVRVVFMPGLGADTPAERRTVVERYLANELVPVVEDHRTTCSDDEATLAAAVDDWLLPENVAWLSQYEDRVILNIANEWLNQRFDNDLWVSRYTDAITRLRAAGLHHLIVVDAGGACGQNPRSIRDRGADIVAADPEHNVAFSVHMYGYWRTAEATDVGTWNDGGTQSPWRISDEVAAIRARGLALVVGEIAHEASSQVRYQTKPALLDLQATQTGFLGWSWNWNSDTALDFMRDNQSYAFNSDDDLSPAGQLFVLDPDVGLRATAEASTAFK